RRPPTGPALTSRPSGPSAATSRNWARACRTWEWTHTWSLSRSQSDRRPHQSGRKPFIGSPPGRPEAHRVEQDTVRAVRHVVDDARALAATPSPRHLRPGPFRFVGCAEAVERRLWS